MKFILFDVLKRQHEKYGNSTHLCKQIIATLASCLLCLSAGLTNGITAVLLPKLEEDPSFDYQVQHGSWIASMSPIASILGSLCIGPILDKFGRKSSHIILAFPFLAGWIAMAFANNFAVMLLGRFITGVSYGAVRPTTMIYLSEISDPKYRGIFLLCPSITINLGIMLSHALCKLLYWRTAVFVCTVPNIILFATLIFVQESPLWLISAGKIEKGTKAFRWFRGEGLAADNELSLVLEKHNKKKDNLIFRDFLMEIFSKGFLKPTLIVFFIFVAVQFCGINAFPFYAHDMLEKMFTDKVDTFLLIIVIDTIRIAVVITICLLAKTMPRKISFICCSFGTSVILGVLVTYLIATSNNILWIPVTCMIVYAIISSIVASLGWTFVAEIFPTRVRGIGTGFSGVICFSLLSLCIKITPDLLELGEAVMYGSFAIITLITSIILCFILPETNGRSLQDIENSYCKEKSTNL